LSESEPAAASAGPPLDMFDWAWRHKLMMLPIVAALVLSVCSGITAMIYISALSGIRNLPLHKQSVQIAAADPRIQAALGEPILGGIIGKDGTVNVSEDNQTGFADIEIPITGPQGNGKLLVKARLDEEVWIIDQLTAVLEDGQVLTLPTELAPPDPELDTESIRQDDVPETTPK
jgi:hypothetical protein